MCAGCRSHGMSATRCAPGISVSVATATMPSVDPLSHPACSSSGMPSRRFDAARTTDGNTPIKAKRMLRFTKEDNWKTPPLLKI